MADAPRAILYARVSTEMQRASGLGLEDQRRQLSAYVTSRAWELLRLEVDHTSAKSLRRPGLQRTLAALDKGEADVLVTAKLDRLTRSLKDFCDLMERAQRGGWSLALLDLGVDTSTPAGEMLANSLANFAQYERRIIGARTSAALQVAKSKGTRLGRPPSLPDKVARRIVRMRGQGMSMRAIAEQLNREKVPTAQGGLEWYSGTVNVVLKRLGEK